MESKRDNVREIVFSILIVGDMVLFVSGLLLAYYFRIESGMFNDWLPTDGGLSVWDYSGHFIFGLILFVVLASSGRLYVRNELMRLRHSLIKLLRLSVYWAVIYLLLSLFFKQEPGVSRVYVLLAVMINFLLLGVWRYVLHNRIKRPGVAGHLRQKIIFAGWSEDIDPILTAVRSDPHHPYEITGILVNEADGKVGGEELVRMGTLDEAEQILAATDAEILVISDIEMGRQRIECLYEMAGRYHLELKLISSFFPLFSSGLRVQTLSGVPLLGVEELPVKQWQNRLLKRGIDILGGATGLLIFGPVILLFSVLVYLESRGPVFYLQQRTSRRGRLFSMIKIRSMRPDAESEGVGWTGTRDPRRLKVGRFMRKWNIDELPQFINVIGGSMSLVGPRPERPELIEKFKYEIRLYNIRQTVKPGMTGWAQIHGWRGDTDLDKRIRHDLYYIENWSVWLDFYIMMMTFFRNENAE